MSAEKEHRQNFLDKLGNFKEEVSESVSDSLQSLEDGTKDLLQRARNASEGIKPAIEQQIIEQLDRREARQDIPLVEGAELIEKNEAGSTFQLSNGVVVPPISAEAYWDAVKSLPEDQQGAFDSRTFNVLSQNPHLAALAKDIESGKLDAYITDGKFDMDAYLKEKWLPEVAEAAEELGLTTFETEGMWEHALSVTRGAIVNAGAEVNTGTVMSYDETEGNGLTEKQYAFQTLIRSGILTDVGIDNALKKAEEKNVAGTSTVELVSRGPLVTFGAIDEIAPLVARSALQFPDKYSTEIIEAAQEVEQNMLNTEQERKALNSDLEDLALTDPDAILAAIQNPDLFPESYDKSVAAQLNSSTMLGVLASRFGREGDTLEESYSQAREQLLSYFSENPLNLSKKDLALQVVRDQAFNPEFFKILKSVNPELKTIVNDTIAAIDDYEKTASEKTDSGNALYDLMMKEGRDVTMDELTLQSAGLYKSLSGLVDDVFKPEDPESEEYKYFRKALVANLREIQDPIAAGNPDAPLLKFGLEKIINPDIVAIDPEQAPRLQAMKTLADRLQKSGDMQGWDAEKFQSLLTYSSYVAAGYPESSFSEEFQSLAPLARKNSDLLMQIVGPLGSDIQSNMLASRNFDGRVPGFPVKLTPDTSGQEGLLQSLESSSTGISKDDLGKLFQGKGSDLTLTNSALLKADLNFTTDESDAVIMQGTYQGTEFSVNLTEAGIDEIFIPSQLGSISIDQSSEKIDSLNRATSQSRALLMGAVPKEFETQNEVVADVSAAQFSGKELLSQTPRSALPYLSVGATGEYVTAVQQLLNDRGYGVEPTGTLSQSDAEVITQIQAEAKLSRPEISVDGIIGPQSWGLLLD